jgi:GNAT superfamily N-acetyltransferase
LPDAVPFYKRLGWEVDDKAQDERVHLENELPGQVYMQYKVRRRSMAKESSSNVAQTVLLEHLDVHSKDAKSSVLLDDVSDLSWDCFSYDIVEQLRTSSAKNPPLLLVLIGRKELAQGEVEDELLGFLAYHLQGPPMRWLSIDLLAVPQHFRGLGYGKRLTKWAMNHAKQMPRSQCASVSCTSPAEAVAFYQKLGFELDKTSDDIKLEQESGVSQPVFMKYKCGREVAKASAKKKSKK